MPRLLTYNVHRCTGLDSRTSPERIAEVIAQASPDIVALQEIDVRRARTGHVDQADMIARALDMRFHFSTVLRTEDEEGYGDVIMTALPMQLVRAARLPGRPRIPGVERRGALWVRVEVDGMPLQVITTHLGLTARERRIQVDALLAEEWLGHPDCTEPLVLLGDFNAVPRSRAYRRLALHLRDAQAIAAGRTRPTFPSRLPVLPLDHLFVSPSLRVSEAAVINSPLARVASDHLPVVIAVEMPERGSPHRRPFGRRA
jgi:endonuclease/exonuclease/phosphatase family metal-dependent hydrolase